MVLIRNRKPSNVGIQLKSEGDGPGCRVLQFRPGTHDYKESDLELINTSSKGVRAYFEGDDPVLREIDGGPERADPTPPAKKSAAELKEMIAETDDPEVLREILRTDDRTTVIAAADMRLADLEGNVPPPPGAGDGVATDTENG